MSDDQDAFRLISLTEDGDDDGDEIVIHSGSSKTAGEGESRDGSTVRADTAGPNASAGGPGVEQGVGDSREARDTKAFIDRAEELEQAQDNLKTHVPFRRMQVIVLAVVVVLVAAVIAYIFIMK